MSGCWQADLLDDFYLSLLANLFRDFGALPVRPAPLDDSAVSVWAAHFSLDVTALLRFGGLTYLLHAADFGHLLADLPRDRVAHLERKGTSGCEMISKP